MGCRTDQVAAVRREFPSEIVIWTDNDDPDDRDAYATICVRDEDGLLRQLNQVTIPGFFDRMSEDITRLLREGESDAPSGNTDA
jgi:hypothetical protein